MCYAFDLSCWFFLTFFYTRACESGDIVLLLVLVCRDRSLHIEILSRKEDIKVLDSESATQSPRSNFERE